MKSRTVLVLIYCTILSFNTGAQNQKNFVGKDTLRNEIFAGFGALTSLDMALSLEYLIMLPIAWGADVYQPHYTGAFFCGYQNRVSERVKLSATFAYEKIRLIGINTPDTKSGNCYSVLGGIKFKYNRFNDNVDLYGRLDLGIMTIATHQEGVSQTNQEIRPSTFACQFSPICVRYGKRVGGFFEFGFGNLGTFNFGMDYRF